jgi:serine/threonine protein kinase
LTGLVNVKVCDFGIAKQTQFAVYESSYFDLTRTGRMLGSPLYMSPEQARSAKHVDQRTDVFSLSIVLWEALSGQRLWGTKRSMGDLVLAICTGPIPRLESVAPWVPRELAEIVHRGLERDLELRYPNMRSMATALEQFTGGAAVKEKELSPVSADTRKGPSTESPSPRADRPNSEATAARRPPGADSRLKLVAWSLVVLCFVLAGLLTWLV